VVRDDLTAMLTRVVLPLAAIAVGGGLLGAALAPSLIRPVDAPGIPPAVNLVVVIVYATAASWLLFGGRRDQRAVSLGAFFLLIASSFSGRLITAGLERELPGVVAYALRGARALRVDAFLPVAFWLFARDFPRTSEFGSAFRLASWGARVSFASATILLLGNLAVRWPLAADHPAGRFLGYLRPTAGGFFWVVVFALTLLALPFIIQKARRAGVEERRRVRLFVGGLLVGVGPLFLEVVLEGLVPRFARLMNEPGPTLFGGLVFLFLLLSIPMTTAYAVAVHQVLDVRLILRRALQYSLARYFILGVTLVPFAGLLVHFYRNRDASVRSLFAGGGGWLLLLATLGGLLTLRLRHRILNGLDRHFFREQYDARRILTGLAQRSRGAAGPEELAAFLRTEIDRALHLESISVLILDPQSGRLLAPGGGLRSLSVSSALAALASVSTQPVDVDLEEPASPLARLPTEEQHWLVDGGVRLLVPILGPKGDALGLVALGAKRSDLPFTSEDRALLEAIAASGALALETLMQARSGSGVGSRVGAAEAGSGGREAAERLALECTACHRLLEPGLGCCSHCGGELQPAPFPKVLLGKFRFERRVGAGGMGVVYRAIDLVLDRPVAIKTLPGISLELSLRLRREARAMAAVSHPNLALILGAESWRGTPMLIFEFLEGGTLGERLARGRLGVEEALDLGIALADAASCLHRAGILHRDIKPSNIGLTAERIPKLLDFGLARIMSEQRPGSAGPAATSLPSSHDLSEDATLSAVATTHSGQLVGTPLYMSPEAMAGRRPEPSFDLWSLAVVIYESIGGRHPFRRETWRQTMDCVRGASAPDLREYRADCGEPVARFFRQALAMRPAQRPSSAREFKMRLEGLRARHAKAG
jgi:eukaryotic-like serine/threonine-protein kinase